MSDLVHCLIQRLNTSWANWLNRCWFCRLAQNQWTEGCSRLFCNRSSVPYLFSFSFVLPLAHALPALCTPNTFSSVPVIVWATTTTQWKSKSTAATALHHWIFFWLKSWSYQWNLFLSSLATVHIQERIGVVSLHCDSIIKLHTWKCKRGRICRGEAPMLPRQNIQPQCLSSSIGCLTMCWRYTGTLVHWGTHTH